MKKMFTFILMCVFCFIIIAPSTASAATVKLNKTKLTLNEGSTYALQVTGTKSKVKWSTSDKNIASVSATGKVKGISAGSAKITASVSTKKLSCTVTIKDVLTDKEAAEKITYEAYELDDYLLFILTNDNKVNLTAEIHVIYYDAGGNVLSKEDNYIWNFQAGKQTVETFSYPRDDSYDKMDYDSFKVIIEADLDSFMIGTSYIDSISIESNSGADSLVATITNNSDDDLSSVNLTVLYYKNSELIGYADGYLFGLDSGQNDIVEFSEPYDENYDKVEYDDYEIIVNEAQ